MAHFKRKRSRNQRAGCKMCKYWKVNGAKPKTKLKASELRKTQKEEK